MPHPSHRLDLWLVFAHAPPVIDEAELARLVGERGEMLVEGGAQRPLLHRWETERFVVNQQGGFRVACPACGANLIAAFSRALGDWRRGGPRQLSCPNCASSADLDALRFAPAAAFGLGAIQLVEVESAELLPAGAAGITDRCGPWRLVARRVG